MDNTLRTTRTRTYRGEPLAVLDNLPGGGAELTPSQLRALSDAFARIAADCEARAAQRGKHLARHEVFDRSEGRCHYCGTTLTLDGRRHVEHMIHNALDGTDTPNNLVAACTSCNLAKSDRTALAFVVLRGFGTTLK